MAWFLQYNYQGFSTHINEVELNVEKNSTKKEIAKKANAHWERLKRYSKKIGHKVSHPFIVEKTRLR